MPSPPSSRPSPPLDHGALERIALRYVERYATSRARLAAYLRRKLRERGFVGDRPPDIGALVERFAARGYVDDQAVAEAKGRSLARRGYGARRLDQALHGLGIAGPDGEKARQTATADAWDTALRYAERRRIGPYAREALDDAGRRRAYAAMLRAGHDPQHVRKIIEAEIGAVPPRDE